MTNSDFDTIDNFSKENNEADTAPTPQTVKNELTDVENSEQSMSLVQKKHSIFNESAHVGENDNSHIVPQKKFSINDIAFVDPHSHKECNTTSDENIVDISENKLALYREKSDDWGDLDWQLGGGREVDDFTVALPAERPNDTWSGVEIGSGGRNGESKGLLEMEYCGVGASTMTPRGIPGGMVTIPMAQIRAKTPVTVGKVPHAPS